MGKIISFTSEKGGVGKSTLNLMLANYIAYMTDYSVALIDCDKHKSLAYIREKDINERGYDPDELYEFMHIDSEDLPNHIEVIRDAFDFVIIDLPGTTEQDGMYVIFATIDYFFIPVALSEIEVGPTNEFYQFLINDVKPLREQHGYETNINGVLNKVNSSTIETKKFIEGDHEYEFEFLKNVIHDTVDLKRNVSTAGIDHKSKKRYHYYKLCDEILNMITNEQ